jgi:hypothetical protein
MPPIPPLAPPAAPITPARPRSPHAVAAQRAFFSAALGKAALQAPAQAVAEAADPRTPAPAAPTPQFDANAPPPSRLMRPGSLIDIKV